MHKIISVSCQQKQTNKQSVRAVCLFTVCFPLCMNMCAYAFSSVHMGQCLFILEIFLMRERATDDQTTTGKLAQSYFLSMQV